MPELFIVIFLLFFAVLAFAYFYLQRAKARTATTVESTDAAVATADSPAAVPAESAASTDAGHDHSDHAGHDHSDPDHQH